MSNIIKYNRIHQDGIRQIGDSKIHLTKAIEEATNYQEANQEVEQLKIEETSAILLEEARVKAKKLVLDAEVEAKRIIYEAKLQAEEVYRQQQIACNEIAERAQYEKNDILQEAAKVKEQILEEAIYEKQWLIQGAEEEIVEVIINLLERIIDEKVIKNVDWLKLIVKKMICTEQLSEDLCLYLPRKCYESFYHELNQQFSQHKMMIRIEVDETLEESACLLETSKGNIHYDLKQSLNEVIQDIRFIQQSDI